MRAISCVEPGRVELIDIARPRAPAGWATVSIANVGICGTDYHIFEGTHPFLAYPRIIGHELSGTILDPGDGALPTGTPVVINPYLSCGHCPACKAGTPNCCENIQVLGVHRDGGMTEEIAVPAGNLYPAFGITLVDAAMVEFLSIGVHAVRRSRLSSGARVLVIGAGPIGLGVAIFARIAEAEVSVLDSEASKVSFAASLGLKSYGLADIDSAVFTAARASGFDAVFDATGSLRSMSAALAHVRNGGSLTLVGVTTGDLVWPDPEVHRRELSLYASRNALRADFEHVMESMRMGEVPTAALATHSTTLDQVTADFPAWSRARTGVVKAIVSIA